MRNTPAVFIILVLGTFALRCGAACADPGGFIVSWGAYVVVEDSALEDFTASAAGGMSHSLGLRSDSSIAALGGDRLT